MRRLVLPALRAFHQCRSVELPHIGTSLILSCAGYFPLWYRHGQHLLIQSLAIYQLFKNLQTGVNLMCLTLACAFVQILPTRRTQDLSVFLTEELCRTFQQNVCSDQLVQIQLVAVSLNVLPAVLFFFQGQHQHMRKRIDIPPLHLCCTPVARDRKPKRCLRM